MYVRVLRMAHDLDFTASLVISHRNTFFVNKESRMVGVKPYVTPRLIYLRARPGKDEAAYSRANSELLDYLLVVSPPKSLLLHAEEKGTV